MNKANKINFILDEGDIFSEDHITFLMDNLHNCKFYIRKWDNFIELATLHNQCRHDTNLLLHKFCKKFKINILKDLSNGNPYWNFYEINCDWSQFQPDIDRCIKENKINYLIQDLQNISTELLQEVINRRSK